MRHKNLLILLVVAIVVVGLATKTVLRRSRRGAVPDRVGRELLAQLQNVDVLNSIVRVEFASPSSTVTVARVDRTWVAPDRYGYPADFGKVTGFLRKLADIKVGQAVVAGEKQLAALELLRPEDVSGATNMAAGTLVTCLDSNGAGVATILIGKQHMRTSGESAAYGGYPDGRYVLVGGDVTLVSETFDDIPEQACDWLDTELLNVPQTDLAGVTVTSTNGARLVLQRPESGGDLVVGDLDGDTEEMDTSKVGGLAGTLNYLAFVDVADPALTTDQTGLSTPLVFEGRTRKGQVYTLRVGGKAESSGDRYVAISASFDPSLAGKPAVSAEDGENDPAVREQEHRDLEQEVRGLNERVGKWTYLVRPYKLDGVTVDRSAFVKSKEAPEQDPSE